MFVKLYILQPCLRSVKLQTVTTILAKVAHILSAEFALRSKPNIMRDILEFPVQLQETPKIARTILIWRNPHHKFKIFYDRSLCCGCLLHSGQQENTQRTYKNITSVRLDLFLNCLLDSACVMFSSEKTFARPRTPFLFKRFELIITYMHNTDQFYTK